MKRVFGLIVAVAVVAVLHLPSRADIVTFRQGQAGYTSSLDNWLGSNLGHNGVNNINSATGFTRVSENLVYILRYDNIFGNNPGQIPLNSPAGVNQPGSQTVITNATMTFATGSGTAMNLHQMLIPWGPTDTNLTLDIGGPTTGLDPGFEISTALGAATTGGVQTVDVTSLVQGWFDGTFPNNGIALTTPGADVAFPSNEGADVNTRPLFTVEFELVEIPGILAPEPGSVALWMLLLGAAVGHVVWKRRGRRAV